jgi:hypothetical protein
VLGICGGRRKKAAAQPIHSSARNKCQMAGRWVRERIKKFNQNLTCGSHFKLRAERRRISTASGSERSIRMGPFSKLRPLPLAVLILNLTARISEQTKNKLKFELHAYFRELVGHPPLFVANSQ